MQSESRRWKMLIQGEYIGLQKKKENILNIWITIFQYFSLSRIGSLCVCVFFSLQRGVSWILVCDPHAIRRNIRILIYKIDSFYLRTKKT